MRILLLTTHLRMGGVPVYVVMLAEALKRLGNDVFVASSGGDLVKRLNKSGTTHFRLNIGTRSELHPKLFSGVYNLFWLVRENNIEIIHANTRVGQVLAKITSFFTGVPYISTCHGFFKPRWGRKIFGCWGKRVIAISEAVREHLVNDFKVRKNKIALIHNGIDPEASKKVFSEEEKGVIRKELGLKGGPVVGIIARLSSVKGHRFLVMAMKQVIDKIKDAQLVIVGEGKEEMPLKELAKQLGIADSVIFEKTVFDTRRALAVMDVFVLPSIKEGLGLALLEALSCSRPCVASDTGGIYSIIKDGETGLLAPPKDSGRLASAILRLLTDRQLAERLGKNGREFVNKNFSLQDMAKKTAAVYKEAIIPNFARPAKAGQAKFAPKGSFGKSDEDLPILRGNPGFFLPASQASTILCSCKIWDTLQNRPNSRRVWSCSPSLSLGADFSNEKSGIIKK